MTTYDRATASLRRPRKAPITHGVAPTCVHAPWRTITRRCRKCGLDLFPSERACPGCLVDLGAAKGWL